MKISSKTSSRNSFIALAIGICTVSSTLYAQEKILPAEKVDSKIFKQDMSYGLGFQNGEQFASYGFIADDIDKEAYIKGLIEALMKKDFGKDPKAYDQAMKAFDKIVTMRERKLADENETAEKLFLEKNGKRKEVITTDSGLQYEILKKGDGKTYTPLEDTTHRVDHATEFHLKSKGTLIDGSIFMETPDDEAMPYTLQVIPGLAEALKIMPVGSKWKLYIPAKLGFSDLRQGPKISPKSTLIYEIELTDIKKKAAAPNLPQPLIPR